jgi:hypothetical protein
MLLLNVYHCIRGNMRHYPTLGTDLNVPGSCFSASLNQTSAWLALHPFSLVFPNQLNDNMQQARVALRRTLASPCRVAPPTSTLSSSPILNATRRHASTRARSFYNTDISGLTEEQEEVCFYVFLALV